VTDGRLDRLAVSVRPLPDGFEPYAWASTAEEVAARNGISVARVIRFDANVPPLPGVPQVPIGESFARLNDYPDGTYRELREAAAAYVGVDQAQIVPGAGADGLIALAARTFLGPGRRACVTQPTYPLYAIASGIEGAEVSAERAGARVIWVCNPNNPTGRRDPAPVATPAARIAAAALREPRLDVGKTVAERERMRRALTAAGFDVPESHANFVLVRTDAAVADRLEADGLVVRRFTDAIRITVRLPAENDLVLAALGAQPEPSGDRSAVVLRTTGETALRVSIDLDGRGRARVATGIGFLDHLLTLFTFHGGLDLDLLAGGDLEVDEHHTVEDVLAALGDALSDALDGRAGVARYGSATVPMDEARATAAVDLVRRPHAEVALAFRGDRVGGLAVTLLPHALQRFAIQAGLTLHVEAAGEDDHHVAEAAFKALGRALHEACSLDGAEVGSTKGAL
jgi:imidazoleglycerol-phosphate dehydratase